MATTIVTKNSTTAASVPSAGSLTQGELAVNVTDKRLFTKDSGGNVVEVGTNPTALAVAGNTTVGGTLGVTGAFSANGGVTLGDASGDALTINSSAVSIPNGLNFDSNTLVIDATNNRVGVGTASPSQQLHISGSAPRIELTDTDTGADSYISADSSLGSLTFSADTNNEVAGSAMRFFVDGSESMRVTSDGNLGIGTSSPSATAKVTARDATYGLYRAENTVGGFATFGVTANATSQGILNCTNEFVFQTGSAERMRIDSSGNLLIGQTTGSGQKLAVVGSGVALAAATFYKQDTTTGTGVVNWYSDVGGSGTIRGVLRVDGGIANYQANNVNLSDERTKKDITDAGSYLDKICAIPVRTFLYKDQPDNKLNLGVIAQEVEAVAPELVDVEGFGDTPEDGIPLKAIYQTDLQYALMKCIQEQHAIITDLKSRIEILESK